MQDRISKLLIAAVEVVAFTFSNPCAGASCVFPYRLHDETMRRLTNLVLGCHTKTCTYYDQYSSCESYPKACTVAYVDGNTTWRWGVIPECSHEVLHTTEAALLHQLDNYVVSSLHSQVGISLTVSFTFRPSYGAIKPQVCYIADCSINKRYRIAIHTLYICPVHALQSICRAGPTVDEHDGSRRAERLRRTYRTVAAFSIGHQSGTVQNLTARWTATFRS